MHYVYVLELESGELYIGYTSDLKRRLTEHNKTKGHCQLLYYESYLHDKTARDRERKLKHYGSAWRSLKKRIGA